MLGGRCSKAGSCSTYGTKGLKSVVAVSPPLAATPSSVVAWAMPRGHAARSANGGRGGPRISRVLCAAAARSRPG